MPITSRFTGLYNEQGFEDPEKNRITHTENFKIMQILILTKRSSPKDHRPRTYP